MGEQGPLEVGQTITSAPRRLSRQACMAFAREFDPQPMHVDEVAAKDGFFGTLTASGWHALAVTMRMAVDARPFGDHPLLGAGIKELRFSRPILPDTDIAARLTFEATETGRGAYSFDILFVETIDVPTSNVLIKQHWRILRQ
ncbi:MAG: MaoC/PaaZ C-terminal domain-containing protein [Pseudomonadota bacterium]